MLYLIMSISLCRKLNTFYKGLLGLLKNIFENCKKQRKYKQQQNTSCNSNTKRQVFD